ncbi:MAG: hypothetical protein WCZ66_04715 [Sphingomonadaceae bacterium]
MAAATLLNTVSADAQMRKVPVRHAKPAAAENWVAGEAKSSACIDTADISGAIVMDIRTVDIMLKGGRRYRLNLANECPQLGYYGGLYYQPTHAGQMCAGRDRIMGRAGAACRVRSMAALVNRQAKPR